MKKLVIIKERSTIDKNKKNNILLIRREDIADHPQRCPHMNKGTYCGNRCVFFEIEPYVFSEEEKPMLAIRCYINNESPYLLGYASHGEVWTNGKREKLQPIKFKKVSE